MRTWKLVAAAVAVAALAGAGIAYATIPGGGGVYSACMLKNVGTVRLIDPSLPPSNLMSHCSVLETPVTWNQQGPQGLPGANGAPGQNGQDGQSVVMGDAGANCANGGVSLTVGSDTRYVCNGANGADGQDGVFTGHFESPNGQYKLDVTDTSITLHGPNARVDLTNGGIAVRSGTLLTLEGGTIADVRGGAGIHLNGCDAPVARQGDQVVVNPSSGIGQITLGTPLVCAG
jgi:hypothetical protein